MRYIKKFDVLREFTEKDRIDFEELVEDYMTEFTDSTVDYTFNNNNYNDELSKFRLRIFTNDIDDYVDMGEVDEIIPLVDKINSSVVNLFNRLSHHYDIDIIQSEYYKNYKSATIASSRWVKCKLEDCPISLNRYIVFKVKSQY